jgi:UDP-galactopyranose mutase
VPIASPANSKEAILAAVGVELYEFFYKGYTQKQWGRPAEALDASVCRRIPIHTGLDERYFRDEFQALPKHGYHAMFEAILEASKADLRLETDYREVLPRSATATSSTPGPSTSTSTAGLARCPTGRRATRWRSWTQDSRAGRRLRPARPPGELPGPRALHEDRRAEARHRPGEPLLEPRPRVPRRVPPGESDPNYPMPGPESDALAARYRGWPRAEPGVTFIGRLAQYRYLNMDQVVGAALHTFDKLRDARA